MSTGTSRSPSSAVATAAVLGTKFHKDSINMQIFGTIKQSINLYYVDLIQGDCTRQLPRPQCVPISSSIKPPLQVYCAGTRNYQVTKLCCNESNIIIE